MVGMFTSQNRVSHTNLKSKIVCIGHFTIVGGDAPRIIEKNTIIIIFSNHFSSSGEKS
jgi:hypothetical protein